MKAVLLTAGKGTRMAKHYEGPKQLLPVQGKPVIEHLLDKLPVEVTDLVLVVGGPHEQKIRDHFKAGEYGGRPITIVRQDEQLGLAHAFRCAKEELVGSGKWFGILPDDVYGSNFAKQLQEMTKHELALLAYRVEKPEMFGVLVTDEQGYLVKAVEKPKEYVSNLVWTGIMLMAEDFFAVEVTPSARGEYETPDVWMKLMQEKGQKIKVVETDFWLPINDKAQLEEAERVLGSHHP